ncbi:type II toxin-antitoxin system RelE/ParE family toxin [Corynebacterium cystitidis]|uniref:Proteic killer suppression protein n=1 Tax=Corynebacterium cystitidis DSM 20524 TaxID=1121357 RepID=A0A1H9RSK2_9CORY|nr:type II toxin-antitoxin system RelE/ParE family toxin [Corynebacterium cystitidis]WJY82058.1 Toxin HigB-1 [Corynebacterium cystitidis DSM 20524]SER75574.1 proteic killer suppression protein [Corynebacterium cystitidis DSM 20524]SNV80065.1 Toxin higB-1 [Corynebacterium cystitidis]
MIVSFADKDTERLFRRQRPKRIDTRLQRRALSKLLVLNAAVKLEELKVPPGNQLELLSGDRVGQHSIRINSQWRICFVWTDEGPRDVEIVDYH